VSLDLSADLAELRDQLRQVVDRELPLASVAARVDSGVHLDRRLWKQLAELGIFRLAVGEQIGGFGYGLLGAAVVAQEMGRALACDPVLPTLVALAALSHPNAPHTARQAATAMMNGDQVGAFCLDGVDADSGSVTARLEDGSWRLSGCSIVVYADLADALVCVGHTDSGPALFQVPARAAGVDLTPLEVLDLTRPACAVRFTDVEADWLGDAAAALTLRDTALTLLAADQVGLMQACLDTTLGYVRIRYQFGRPVGSYQAVKHRLADMLCALELCRSALLDAARAADERPEEFCLAAAVAQAACSTAAFRCARDTLQLHGGIGFTWESHLHLFFRRAKASEHLLGQASGHRRRAVALAAAAGPVVHRASEPDDPTAELARFRALLRVWLSEHAPRWEQVAASGRDDAIAAAARGYQQELAAAGYAGLTWPAEFGGQNRGPEHQRIYLEEASRYRIPQAPLTISLGMCGPLLMMMGTRQQQDQHVRRILAGEELWCQLFSEPSAGSDLAGLRTSARRDGDEWVVTGQKVWTTAAQFAQFGILLARTDPSSPKHDGLTMFLLDMSTPGITVRPLRQMNGAADFNEVFLDDVRLPADAVIGAVNGGWKAAIAVLMNERASLGTARPWTRQAIYDPLLAVAADAGRLSDPVAVDGLADVLVRARCLELLGERIRDQLRADADPGPFASITKLTGAALRMEVAELAVDLALPGTLAWPAGDPTAADQIVALLTAPSAALAGGTDNILRNTIAERVLGLPKEPGVDRNTPFRDLKTGTQASSARLAAPSIVDREQQ
jgi:alkylation response protein AidB-like acyl-CoA dehydrogenase